MSNNQPYGQGQPGGDQGMGAYPGSTGGYGGQGYPQQGGSYPGAHNGAYSGGSQPQYGSYPSASPQPQQPTYSGGEQANYPGSQPASYAPSQGQYSQGQNPGQGSYGASSQSSPYPSGITGPFATSGAYPGAAGGYAGTGSYPGSGPVSGQNGPSRVPGIVLTAIGVIVTLGVSVAVLLFGTNANQAAARNSLESVSDGDTVTIDKAGFVMIVEDGGDVSASCEFSGEKDISFQQGEVRHDEVDLVAENVPAGDYTLSCSNTGSLRIGRFDAPVSSSAFTSALGMSAIPGVIGLALVLLGVFLLVRANKAQPRAVGY